MGGSKDPDINDPSNLVLLCEACHLRQIEIHRSSGYDDGFLVYADARPWRVPVKIYARGFIYLTRDGRYSVTPPGD